VKRLASRALDVEPSDGSYYQRAVARFALGDLEKALEDVAGAEQYRPRNEWYHALGALVLLAQNGERAAAERLIAGLRIHPRGPHLLPLLAYLAALHGDLERARALEAEARKSFAIYARCFLALEPTWRAAAFARPPHDVLGRALVLEQDLAAVVPAEPSRSLVTRRRGEEQLQRGEIDAALALAERALWDDPADGSARLLKARCCIALGYRDAALHELEFVETLAPNRAADARAARALAEGLR
jgi:Flp pilus assembly protein TadD